MSRNEIQILLVEDDPNDVELALIALRRDHSDIRIQVARDGEEALEFLFCRGAYSERSFNPPPRLILLDLKLPKLTGLEVLREIKNDSRTRPIPVAALTSSKQHQDMMECYQLGVNSYIQKPIDFEHFQKTINDLSYYWLTVNQSLPIEAFIARNRHAE